MSNSPEDQMFQMLISYWQQRFPDDPIQRNNCRRISQRIEAGLSAVEREQLRSNPTTIEHKLRMLWTTLVTQDPTIRVLLPPPQITSAWNSEPASLPLTLRFAQRGRDIEIFWDSEVIGSATSQFESPYQADGLRDIIEQLEFAQQWARNPLSEVDIPQTQSIHAEVGRTLFEALIKDPNANRALQSTRDYATRQGKVVHYILRIPPALIEIAALPWELLWDRYGPIMLSRGKVAFCTRYPDFDFPLEPARPPSRKIHIVAITPKIGLDAGIREAEKEARQRALQSLINSGLAFMHTLSPATLEALNNYISTNPPIDVIHFYGHGDYIDGQGVLLFDHPDPTRGHYVTAHQIATALGGIPLVILHACRSAMVNDGGLLTAVAPALSAAGVPAVIGMQLTVQTRHATRFSEVIYHELVKGTSLHHAVGRGRQVLYSEESSGAGWYVPTLTLRSSEPIHLIRR